LISAPRRKNLERFIALPNYLQFKALQKLSDKKQLLSTKNPSLRVANFLNKIYYACLYIGTANPPSHQMLNDGGDGNYIRCFDV
jgi:hypothetical protein